MSFETHRFFCCKCANEGIPIARRSSHKHGAFHKKKLWCLNCKDEINHIEIRSSEEIDTFLNNFKNGVYASAL